MVHSIGSCIGCEDKSDEDGVSAALVGTEDGAVRPEDISERAWEAAMAITLPYGHEAVARAIDAETARCAKIATDYAAACQSNSRDVDVLMQSLAKEEAANDIATLIGVHP